MELRYYDVRYRINIIVCMLYSMLCRLVIVYVRIKEIVLFFSKKINALYNDIITTVLATMVEVSPKVAISFCCVGCCSFLHSEKFSILVY